jgi:hypothetical protein
MHDSFKLKTAGYLVSTTSVVLLAAAAWEGASKKPILLVCLIAGAVTSIAGMLLRWYSYKIDKEK